MPLWVLTGSVTGTVVSTGATVVTTTGPMVVSGATIAAGRVGCRVGCRVGGRVGRSTMGGVGTAGSDSVGHGPFSL